MTFHLFSGDTYQCGECGAYFIPFSAGLPCPKCAAPAAEFQDFIPEAAAGLMIHKQEYGRYEPGAYFVGGLPEHIFLILTRVFDAGDGSEEFRSAVEHYLDSCNFGDQAYMRPHIQEIAIRVRQQMDHFTL
jgi:hypothetical protein